IINDVQGLQGDPDMARIAADTGAPVIAMHNRDTVDAAFDIMADISEFFVRTIDIAEKAGISRDKIVLDPGIGFGKTPEQSMQVLARLAELTQYGFPILVGASRKRFIASVTPSEPEQRLGGSLAAHLLAALNGAAIIRTHDVYDTVQALRIASAIEGER
ncbi:MAG: dihydropteroate synthase, partial [Rhizobiaceae bacterium]